jgi:membrane protein
VAASLDRLSMPSGLEAAVLRVVPVAVSAALFFLLYRIIPNRHVPARHALAGGILAAAVFEMMKSVFAAYIRAVPTYQLVYGAFASIPIFLVWLYLSWLVVLLGAEFTASLAWWRGPRGLHGDARSEEDRAAYAVGRALAMAGGVPVALASLGEAAGLPDDRMEDLLERLARTGAVGREDEGWVALPPGKAAGG